MWYWGLETPASKTHQVFSSIKISISSKISVNIYIYDIYRYNIMWWWIRFLWRCIELIQLHLKSIAKTLQMSFLKLILWLNLLFQFCPPKHLKSCFSNIPRFHHHVFVPSVPPLYPCSQCSDDIKSTRLPRQVLTLVTERAAWTTLDKANCWHKYGHQDPDSIYRVVPIKEIHLWK